jgi:transcriptional regulator with XRE-family HTH domain
LASKPGSTGITSGGVERDEINPSYAVLLKLTGALGVPASELVSLAERRRMVSGLLGFEDPLHVPRGILRIENRLPPSVGRLVRLERPDNLRIVSCAVNNHYMQGPSEATEFNLS